MELRIFGHQSGQFAYTNAAAHAAADHFQRRPGSYRYTVLNVAADQCDITSNLKLGACAKDDATNVRLAEEFDGCFVLSWSKNLARVCTCCTINNVFCFHA